jgi:hypothetical protein
MLEIVQVATLDEPPVEVQLPDHAADEPVSAVAVNITAVPELMLAEPSVKSGYL